MKAEHNRKHLIKLQEEVDEAKKMAHEVRRVLASDARLSGNRRAVVAENSETLDWCCVF